jgi:hypothetical protein
MALWDMFRRKSAPSEIVEKIEVDEEKNAKRELNRENNRMAREMLKLELENKKIENLARQQEMRAQIEESKLDLEIRRLEKQKLLNDLRADVFGDDEEEEEAGDPADDMFSSLIAQVIQKTQNHAGRESIHSPPVILSPPTDAVIEISDEEIKNRWQVVPENQKAILRTLSDDKLKEVLIQQIPNISKSSIERAIPIIRGA